MNLTSLQAKLQTSEIADLSGLHKSQLSEMWTA